MYSINPKVVAQSKIVAHVEIDHHITENFFAGPYDTPVISADVERLVALLNAAERAYRIDNRVGGLSRTEGEPRTFEFDDLRLRYEVGAPHDLMARGVVFRIYPNDN